MNKRDNVGSKNATLDKKVEAKSNKKALKNQFKEEVGYMEEMEDVTKYGEFVSSYFAWLTLEKQKANAKRMEDIVKK